VVFCDRVGDEVGRGQASAPVLGIFRDDSTACALALPHRGGSTLTLERQEDWKDMRATPRPIRVIPHAGVIGVGTIIELGDFG
jgi:hypothetical protein